MKLTSRLTGLDGLNKALSRVADEAELRAQIQAAADGIRKAARAKLSDGQPPDTRSGELAGSLTVETSDDGMSASVGTPLDYGWHLEMGSLARPATPWLEPAFAESLPGVMSRIKLWLANSARRARR